MFPSARPGLSDHQKAHRLQFSISKQEETLDYWERVYFLDEQRFGLVD